MLHLSLVFKHLNIKNGNLNKCVEHSTIGNTFESC